MTKLTTRQARKALVFGTDDEEEAVQQELATLASSDFTGGMSWVEQGRVAVKRAQGGSLHTVEEV